MHLFYRFVRFLVKLTLEHYFHTIDKRGASPVEDKPLLIVSNHPNYLLDPLLIATSYRRPLWIIAKSVIFNTLTRPLLYFLHAIPIYRRMDNPDQMHKNKDSFQEVIARFQLRGAVLIFPEGLSINQRAFEPIKSGAARIAISALEENKCEELLIQPVGLTYSTFHRVRAAVTIHFGEPLSVKSYLTNLEHPAEAVQLLTQTIRDRLASLTVEVEDESLTHLIEKITTVYSSLNTHTNYHQRLQSVKSNLLALESELPQLRQHLEPQIDRYLSLLNKIGLGTGSVLTEKAGTLETLLLLPFHLIALLIEFIPYQLIRFLLSKFEKDFKTGSLQFGFAFILYPLWYLCLSVLLSLLTKSVLVGAITFVVCFLSINLHYKRRDQTYLRALEMFWPGDSNPVKRLSALQQDLIEKLEKVRRV